MPSPSIHSRSSSVTIGVSTKPGQIASMRCPLAVRRHGAHVPDDCVLRERVDRIRGIGMSPASDAVATIEPPAPYLLQAPHAEDDAVDVDADHSPVAGEVIARPSDAGVQEREVDRHGLPSSRVGDVEAGGDVERLHRRALLLEAKDDGGADPRRAAGDERATERGRLSRRAAVLDQPVGVRCLGERELCADHGLHRAGGPQFEELPGSLDDDVGPPRHQPAEVEALDADVPAHEQRGVELLPPAARVADGDERAERREDGDARREEVAADWVHDDVRAHRLGELVVAERLFGALLEAESPLLLGRRGRDDSRAEVPRALDGRGTHTTGAGMHEHRLSGLESYLARQRDPGREEREQERRALRERRALGQRKQPLGVDRDTLRVAAACQQRHDAAAVLGLAGDLHAGDRRQLRRLRVVPLPDEEVEKIHARGANMEQGLSLGHVRIGHVLKRQLLGAARLLDDDRLHAALRRSACSEPTRAARPPRRRARPAEHRAA